MKFWVNDWKFCRSFVFLLGLLSSCSVFSSGIDFEHGSWESVLLKARQEGKMVFVDVHTEWCGPCMKMEKEVFSVDEVGDFFNERFISYKMDAEKGEGVELSEKFSVQYYPTFLFFSASGDLAYRFTGYANSSELLEHAKRASDPLSKTQPLAKMAAEFNSGNRDREFVVKYFEAIRVSKGSADYPLGLYLTTLEESELLTEDVYGLIDVYATNVKGMVYGILIENFDKYSGLVGEKRVVGKITAAYLRAHSRHVGAGFAEKYVNDTVLDHLKMSHYPYKDKLIMEMSINYLGNCEKYKEVDVVVREYVEKYGRDCPSEIEGYVRSSLKRMGLNGESQAGEMSHQNIGNFHADDPRLFDLLLNASRSFDDDSVELLEQAFAGIDDKHMKAKVANLLVNQAVSALYDPEVSQQEKDAYRARGKKYANIYIHELSDAVPDVEYSGRKIPLNLWRVKGALFDLQSLVLGQKLPDLQFVNLDGEKDGTGNYAGKVLLIDFWTTWCGPCKASLPHIAKMTEDLSDSRFQMISIACDEDVNMVHDFLEEEHPMPWVNWHSPELTEEGESLGVSVYPTYIVVDAEGTVRLKSHYFDVVEPLVRKLAEPVLH